MKKLLYIDACIRDEQSRTKRIATPIVEALKQKYEVHTLVINDLDLSIVKKELVTIVTSSLYFLSFKKITSVPALQST